VQLPQQLAVLVVGLRMSVTARTGAYSSCRANVSATVRRSVAAAASPRSARSSPLPRWGSSAGSTAVITPVTVRPPDTITSAVALGSTESQSSTTAGRVSPAAVGTIAVEAAVARIRARGVRV
jgi:hypothetical protein